MVSATLRKNMHAFVLAGTLAGCMTATKPEVIPQAVSANSPSLEARIRLESFSAFNPPSAENPISLSQSMIPYIMEGLDYEEKEAEKSRTIAGYFAFEKEIYATAQELGYSREEVIAMTPKESLALTAKIVAHRMDYFATSGDHDDNEAQKSRREKVRSLFDRMREHPKASEEEKKNAIRGMFLLEEVAKKQAEIHELERTMNEFGGIITYRAGFDSLVSSSDLFMQQQPIVCRQYASIGRDIFFILKQGNPRLVNTHVAVYNYRNHVWNQATTLYRDQGRLCIDITFLDSTWLDSIGTMEGYDDAHFGNHLMLTSQLQKFTTAMNPPKQQQVAMKKN